MCFLKTLKKNLQRYSWQTFNCIIIPVGGGKAGRAPCAPPFHSSEHRLGQNGSEMTGPHSSIQGLVMYWQNEFWSSAGCGGTGERTC